MVVTPSWASRCISCGLWISGPSERTVAPSASASSTISTARSTPKQNPYSSAKRTSIVFTRSTCRSGGAVAGSLGASLFAAVLPVFPQSIASGHPIVNPLNLPIDAAADGGEQRFLQITYGVSNVVGQNGVG